MASIKSTLALNDGMSAVLKKINRAMNLVLDSFDAVQQASGQTFDTRSISEARRAIGEANAKLDEMEEEYKRINDSQQKLNSGLSTGTDAACGLLGKIAQIAGAYVSIKSIGSFLKESVESAMEAANIDTQLAVSLDNQGLGRGAYDQIKEAASEYGMYTQTAMTGAAAEFATYLSDTDAIESMMGSLADYAAGMSGGGALDTSQMVDYATQLGKVLNGSFDGIAKKGFEVSDAQKEIIENGTDMEKVAVVADIIKESWGGLYEQMANTPQGQLLQMQNTISQIKENVGNQLMPYIMQIVQLIQDNMPTIETIINGIGSALSLMIPVLAWIINAAAVVANFFINNWSWIKPIIIGIVGAFLLWKAVTLIMTAVQWALNTALLANPITWIILIIVAVIAVIYKWVESVGGITNAWNICKAALMVAWAGIKVGWAAVVYGITWGVNKVLNFVDLMKLCWQRAGVAIANFMGDMKVSVLTILQNMINGAIDIINGFIGVLNLIPGVSIDTINHVTFATEAAAENEAAKQARAEDLAAYEQDIANAKAEREANLQAAYDNITSAQDELAASVAELAELYAASQAGGAAADETGGYDPADYVFNGGASGGDSFDPMGYGDTLDSIAGDTGSIADATDKSSEELAYLRDIAEKEAINRFTTAEIKVDMTGMNNHIESDMDIDGVISHLAEELETALLTAAEGVH